MGGGPAGLGAAAELAASGADRVEILERTDRGRHSAPLPPRASAAAPPGEE
ncbi:hypothetical protein [Streptomyces sp. NPDC057557]|uniref:hypothetical protein n=1 Tax=Streptomyces sp. NPDC057557 TaxID=3346167 RepID=UPI003686053F